MSGQTSRNRILQTARNLFSRKGFANATVREICERAAITPPTLYHHFGDKGGLFEAVVEETLDLEEFHQVLSQAVAAAPGPREGLQAYIRTYLAHFPTDLLNPGLHLQDSTELSGTSLRRLQTGLSDLYELTCDLLDEGIARGAFRPVPVDTTASCLMGIVDSFVRARVYLGLEYDVERIAGCVDDLLMRGLTGANRDEAEFGPT